MRNKNSLSHASTFTLVLAFAGVIQGCSTIADDSGGSAGGPEPPNGFENNGLVVECQPAGEPVPTTGEFEGPLLTCVAIESIGDGTDVGCFNHGLRKEYLQAICARTFGGFPQDYLSKPVGGWKSELDDYPTTEFEDYSHCDVTESFANYDEVPEATDMVPLDSGQYDRCSSESYCETRAEIIDEYPSFGLEPDPWCNLYPGGDSMADRPWVCVGSADDQAHDGACGEAYLPDEDDVPTLQPICPITKFGGTEYCVIASSESQASTKCEELCDDQDVYYLDKYGAVIYPTRLDCEVFGPNTMVWVSDVGTQCYNPYYEYDPMNVSPFSFTSDLLIDGGANASSSDENVGVIDYRVENCVGLVCDIIIEGLQVSYTMYAGTFYDDVNDPFPYSVDGVSIRLVEPVQGTVTSTGVSPPVVAFPSETFELVFSTGNVKLDGSSLGALGPISTHTDQVTGFYSGGVLTLNIGYESIDASMALTLTTF